MKIEKVNDNQIRCTLTREDLASRELKISELAYGTEKAKSLFRDMMQQANFEFGFEAEDIPLMIEAIPLNAECIVLIITKVEDPEELDTRFSRFAPSVTEDLDSEGYEGDESPEEVAELFQKIQDKDRAPAAPAAHTSRTIGVPETDVTRTRLFQFDSLRQVWDAAAVTGTAYHGLSTLYKAERSGKYLLVLTQNGCEKEHFDRICSILSEYGSMKRTPASGHAFLQEHCQPLIPENALATLGNL
ncbi:MAG: adaptor protein MecA [Lachnospiraceae bacterium]|nr:adaptor protein MecA [Lachnospiraceae bacterium]